MKRKGNFIIETSRERQENNRRISIIVSKIQSYLDTGKINHYLVYNHIRTLVNSYGYDTAMKRIGERLQNVKEYEVLNSFLMFGKLPLFMVDKYDEDVFSGLLQNRP